MSLCARYVSYTPHSMSLGWLIKDQQNKSWHFYKSTLSPLGGEKTPAVSVIRASIRSHIRCLVFPPGVNQDGENYTSHSNTQIHNFKHEDLNFAIKDLPTNYSHTSTLYCWVQDNALSPEVQWNKSSFEIKKTARLMSLVYCDSKRLILCKKKSKMFKHAQPKIFQSTFGHVYIVPHFYFYFMYFPH
jgi:hypothetical protein